MGRSRRRRGRRRRARCAVRGSFGRRIRRGGRGRALAGRPFFDVGAHGIETRGVSDHGFIRSIYFYDPNGYVIELTARTQSHDEAMDPARNGARAKLDRWTKAKRETLKA